MTKWHVCPAKTQISLGIGPVWSDSSLWAQWVAKDQSFLHADSKDSDQTGRMPRLIWVFAGHTSILLVLSWGGSFVCSFSWCIVDAVMGIAWLENKKTKYTHTLSGLRVRVKRWILAMTVHNICVRCIDFYSVWLQTVTKILVYFSACFFNHSQRWCIGGSSSRRWNRNQGQGCSVKCNPQNYLPRLTASGIVVGCFSHN